MFMLYVSDVACERFLCILTLMMWFACSSSYSLLVRDIGGGSVRAYTSALSHGTFFMADVLVC